MNKLNQLMKNIDYSFKKLELLKIALTHSSFKKKEANNERLEFLGDRVLGLIISQKLFNEFKNDSEGELAKKFSYLVCKKTLKSVANDIFLKNHIKTSTDLKSSTVDSILSNSLEAIIAAIFLDSDLKKTSIIVLRLWKKYLHHIDLTYHDPKSQLQEWSLKNKKVLPVYNNLKKKNRTRSQTLFFCAS